MRESDFDFERETVCYQVLYSWSDPDGVDRDVDWYTHNEHSTIVDAINDVKGLLSTSDDPGVKIRIRKSLTRIEKHAWGPVFRVRDKEKWKPWIDESFCET